MLPAEFHKVLANIRKVEARTKKHKLLNKAEEEGSDSEEDTPKAKTDRCSSFLMHFFFFFIKVWTCTMVDCSLHKDENILTPNTFLEFRGEINKVEGSTKINILFLCACSIEDILAETDSEDEKPKKGQKKPVKQKAQAWLKEGVSDEPLNFLDPKAAQRVLCKKFF